MAYQIRCWKCLKLISEIPVQIGFRASCSHCNSDLHVCVNCRYYAPGKPNDCLVPGTEPIRDREAANFCEEYKPALPSTKAAEDQAGKIKNFHSLFKDID